MILKGVWSVAKKKNKTKLHLYQLSGAFQMYSRERIIFHLFLHLTNIY